MYDLIKNYLQIEPRARERQFHQRGMVNLLLKDYPELNQIPRDKLVDFCHNFESYTRIWRKVVEENPDLRGTDYLDKTDLELEKQRSLGYNL